MGTIFENDVLVSEHTFRLTPHNGVFKKTPVFLIFKKLGLFLVAFEHHLGKYVFF